MIIPIDIGMIFFDQLLILLFQGFNAYFAGFKLHNLQKAPFFLVIPDIVHGGEIGGIFAEEAKIVFDVVSEIVFDL